MILNKFNINLGNVWRPLAWTPPPPQYFWLCLKYYLRIQQVYKAHHYISNTGTFLIWYAHCFFFQFLKFNVIYLLYRSKTNDRKSTILRTGVVVIWVIVLITSTLQPVDTLYFDQYILFNNIIMLAEHYRWVPSQIKLYV